MLNKVVQSAVSAGGSTALGLLAPLVTPPVHIAILYYFWSDFTRKVDRAFCSCSCSDLVFKGTYESGIASYKHMYFNATNNMLKIWMTIVVGVIVFYEAVKYLALLGIQKRLRWRMFFLFSTAVFSHYYSWWVYINYWNDDFYSQWYHQLFFSITELISTLVVIHLADKKNIITRRKTFVIVGIALLHILAGGWDQFVINVVRGEGYAHQVVRDLGFMIPDILHLIIPLCSLQVKKDYSLPGTSLLSGSDLKKDLLYMIVGVTVGLGLCSRL